VFDSRRHSQFVFDHERFNEVRAFGSSFVAAERDFRTRSVDARENVQTVRSKRNPRFRIECFDDRRRSRVRVRSTRFRRSRARRRSARSRVVRRFVFACVRFASSTTRPRRCRVRERIRRIAFDLIRRRETIETSIREILRFLDSLFDFKHSFWDSRFGLLSRTWITTGSRLSKFGPADRRGKNEPRSSNAAARSTKSKANGRFAISPAAIETTSVRTFFEGAKHDAVETNYEKRASSVRRDGGRAIVFESLSTERKRAFEKFSERARIVRRCRFDSIRNEVRHRVASIDENAPNSTKNERDVDERRRERSRLKRKVLDSRRKGSEEVSTNGSTTR